MQHPNTGPAVASPRLRPSGAPTNPAVKAAGGRKTTLPVYLHAREDDGFPRPVWNAQPIHLTWTGSVTPTLRRRLENKIELCIALLDALDAAGMDLEPDDEGGCEVEDVPASTVCGLGEPDDAEDGGDAESSLGWPTDYRLRPVVQSRDDTDRELDSFPCGDRLTNAAWCPL